MRGNMGAHLQVVDAKYVVRSRKYATTEESSPSLEMEATTDTELAAKRKARAMQENRMAHIEALRARVRAGTYQVDKMLLAQRILEDESHFMEKC